MANITSLTELTEVADDDLLVAVDKSDTTMADSGTNKKVKKSSLAKSLLDFFYPVGTIYETTSSDLDTVAKMNAHFGGTWEVYGSGRVLVAKSSETEFNALGKTGGAKTHTLTINEMPSHSHRQAEYEGSVGGIECATALHLNWLGTFDGNRVGLNTATAGGGQAHNNLQPYIVVYRYRRTA